MEQRHSLGLKLVFSLLNFLPLGVFVLIARARGLLEESQKSLSWQEPFVWAAGVALAVIILQIVTGTRLNRFMLGVNIFLIGGACIFLSRSSFLLDLFDRYTGPAFFLALTAVGFITTFFTKDGFTGDANKSYSEQRKASFTLVGGSTAALIWSFIFTKSGIMLSLVAPFVALRLLYHWLERN